ncbi:MAG: hypothetical protein MK180_16500 [Rhodobacteraceae bacterium]|nr:hypothetical protein [Paracoccaceae bacterium]
MRWPGKNPLQGVSTISNATFEDPFRRFGGLLGRTDPATGAALRPRLNRYWQWNNERSELQISDRDGRSFFLARDEVRDIDDALQELRSRHFPT